MGRNIPNDDLIIELDPQNPDEGRGQEDASYLRTGYERLDKNEPAYDLDRRGLGTPVSSRPRRWPRNSY